MDNCSMNYHESSKNVRPPRLTRRRGSGTQRASRPMSSTPSSWASRWRVAAPSQTTTSGWSQRPTCSAPARWYKTHLALNPWHHALDKSDLFSSSLAQFIKTNIHGDGLAESCRSASSRRTVIMQALRQVEHQCFLGGEVWAGAAVLRLPARENKALLIGRGAHHVLDRRLHVVSLKRLNSYAGDGGDGLAGQRLHEEMHATIQAWLQVKCRLLLDVAV